MHKAKFSTRTLVAAIVATLSVSTVLVSLPSDVGATASYDTANPYGNQVAVSGRRAVLGLEQPLFDATCAALHRGISQSARRDDGCGREDSNLHPRKDQDLNLARMPISPRPLDCHPTGQNSLHVAAQQGSSR